MKKLLPIFFLAALIFSCKEDEPIAVNQFSLPLPSGAPTINRSTLVTGGSFAVGYTNGNIRSDRVTLNWQRSGDADFLAYKILRDGFPVQTITDVQTTSFTDSGLIQNRYYTYSVAMLNQKALHRLDTITVKTPRFQTPTITFQVLIDTTLQLLWGRTAESATSYRLEKSTNGGVTFQVLATVPDTFYNDRSVTNLAIYYYRITASSPYETTPTSTAYSVQVRYQMFAPSFFSSPQQLLPTRQVRLWWYDNSTAEEGFRVYRRRGVSGTYTQIGTAMANSASYTDTDTNALAFDSTYYYQVQAYNQRDTSGRSGIGSITIFRPAPRPTWVARPPSSMGANTNYTVSWNVAQRTYNTRVYWSGAANGSSTTQSGPGGTTYSATLNFSTPGVYYIYARYWDSLNVYSYQTDTVVSTVTGGGALLNEGFESGVIPLGWTTGGNATWFVSAANPLSGFYSARSGTIVNNGLTQLQTAISFSGIRTISFYYRVSSESGFDYLRFYVNGVQLNSWSGETGWQFYSTGYSGSGTVDLRWVYGKDGSGSVGQDAAWIDNVVVQ